jgi:glyoxylate reductase
MSRLSLFVASEFLEEVRSDLQKVFDCTIEPTRTPVDRMRSSGRSHDALLFSLDVPMGSAEIAALPESVAALATYSVGTDHIDLAAAARRGLAVFNTPGVLSDSVAENALFLMLGAARRATESIELIRSRTWPGWNPTQLVGVELVGRTLGILGMGDIGGRIAQRARAFGMEIAYCNRKPLPESESDGARYVASPEGLIATSDVLMLACPSTEQTRRIVDAELLSHAKPGLILVNIARGDLVVDEALVAALRSGRVRGAGLDVFAGEPDLAPDYYELPNVFMLPHIGSSTIEARRRMGRILIDALLDWRAGGSPANRVC